VFDCPYLDALERDSWVGIYFAGERRKKKKQQSGYTIRKGTLS
jgi:hypothetical protein